MIAPFRLPLCVSLFVAVVLFGCASQPQATSPRKLKLETIQRPLGGPTTYLYREVGDSR